MDPKDLLLLSLASATLPTEEPPNVRDYRTALASVRAFREGTRKLALRLPAGFEESYVDSLESELAEIVRKGFPPFEPGEEGIFTPEGKPAPEAYLAELDFRLAKIREEVSRSLDS